MIFVTLPDSRERRLPFYLAMEEYLASRDDAEYFFMWQVPPTVIIGRNQHLLPEVNIDYCHGHNIDIVRRKSGGGCVYSDHGNIMFSYITTSPTVTTTFNAYTAMVASMLQQLGVGAAAGGRNDIIVDGRKVSGNSFYHKGNRAIVHGTMLFNTDVDEMLRAITPSRIKLTSKGIESVRSRVANLSEFLSITIEEFKELSASLLCDSQATLSPDEVRAIEKLEAGYYTDSWLYGKSPKAGVEIEHHVDGVGEMKFSIVMKGDRIQSINLQGDFFLLSDLDDMLLSHLIGIEYNREALTLALKDVQVDCVIAHLTNEELVNTLMIPYMENENKKTCLHDRHVKLGALMSPFGGFDMPIQYAGIVDEHQAVRTKVGVFDVSHMGEVRITGADATKYVNHIFTNDVSGGTYGKCFYGMMLHPHGGVVDDLLVYRRSATDYFLVINASNIDKDVAWIESHTVGYDVKVEHLSDMYGELAIQGPDAEKTVKSVLGIDCGELEFYTFKDIEVDGTPVIVSRTGYTGEDGFEIYTTHELTVKFWDKLMAAGVQPCGLGCRDTLRFEVGLPLYGDELADDITPVEAGLSMFVKLDKPNMIGGEAVAAQKADGPKRKLVGLELSDRAIPRHGYEVLNVADEVVGHVTTGYHAISVDKSIAMALVDAAYSARDTELKVRIRRKTFPCKVVPKKFYKKSYKK
ncbi:MAG: glycine cleavage system aminomethyltransferase GcvT [Clostridiales bacterium]|nr:glycine cleavage system aminomethyltransferase GcvT [Clostridiales bacterium]